jgi:hypothetical protein
MNNLVRQISYGDHRQRKSPEKIMAPCGKDPRPRVPNQKHSNVSQRHGTKNDRKSPMGPIQTVVHSSLLTVLRKEFVRDTAKADHSGS